jgi:hypothetical protein
VSSPEGVLVDGWDRACSVDPALRGLALLETLEGEAALAEQPVGRATACALRAAQRWFGPELETVFACGACGETMEVRLEVDDLLASAPEEIPASLELMVAGRRLVVRPLRPSDLAAARATGDADGAARMLLERAVVSAEPALAGPDLEGLAGPVSEALERCDPLGLVTVDVACPACGAAATPVLDVVDWCWTVADAHVARLLEEVDALARAYGWSEREILALAPRRRAAYLELVA